MIKFKHRKLSGLLAAVVAALGIALAFTAPAISKDDDKNGKPTEGGQGLSMSNVGL
jgi:hypothetical protein